MRHSREAPSNPDLTHTPPGLTAPQFPVLEEGSRGLLPAQGGPRLPVRPARWLHLHGTKAVLFGGPHAVVPAQSIACWSGAGPGSVADADGSRWDPGLPEGLGPDMGSGGTVRAGVLCQSRMGTVSLLLVFQVTLLSPGLSPLSLHPGNARFCHTMAGDAAHTSLAQGWACR